MKSTVVPTEEASTIRIECSELNPIHRQEISRQADQFAHYLESYGSILEGLDAEKEPEESSGRAAMACILRAQALVGSALNNLSLAEDALAGLRTASEIGFPEFERPDLEP